MSVVIWPAPDGSLWVALFSTNRLARIDTATWLLDPSCAGGLVFR